jgi:hypothetical protein
MRGPGIEPGYHRWQRQILTAKLPTHENERLTSFLKLIVIIRQVFISLFVFSFDEGMPPLLAVCICSG